MDNRAHPVGVHGMVPPSDRSSTGDEPDYQDSFEVVLSSIDGRTAQEWSRDVFEGGPRPVRWFLLAGWRAVLGLRLGPRRSPDHVLGWRISSSEPDIVRLELRSSLMTARLFLCRSPSTVVLSTTVHYTRRIARPLWAAVGPIHRRTLPYLLTRASSSRARTAAGRVRPETP